VERITTGFITGAAVIKTIADVNGIPFLTKLRNTGIDTQSHTGRQNPPNRAKAIPAAVFFGKCRSMNRSDTKKLIKDESSTPVIKNGKACSTIPKKAKTMRTSCEKTAFFGQFATHLQI